MGERTMYGLRHKVTRRLLGLSVDSNGDGECCGACSATLEEDLDSTPYLVERRSDAEAVLQGVPWYNSGMSQPQLGCFRPEDLEVVPVALRW